MSKLTKDALKVIIKECLVEILSEGLGSKSQLKESFDRKPAQTQAQRQPTIQSKRTIFDQMGESFQNKKKQLPTGNSFDKIVKNTVNMVTDDPLLQSLLEDTARTTYQEQMGHETRTPSAFGSQEQHDLLINESVPMQKNAGLDLEGLFGSDITKNWDELVKRTS
jgi:hypothetical protein